MRKILSSIICMLVVTLMWTPSSLAKDFSEKNIAGCYVASLDGFFLDPTSGQSLPTANLVRFCTDGKGEGTSVKITHNIAGCFIVEQEEAGDVTYVVLEDGTGEVEAVVVTAEVIDLCYGSLPLPIVEGERTKFNFRIALDEKNIIRVLGTDLILLDAISPPFSIPIVIQGEAVRQSDPLSAFVTRFYQQCLNRGPDQGGLDNWIAGLRNGTLTGSDVARGVVVSQEFTNRNTSNEDYVTIMYRAFFDREPDTGGYNGWLSQLNSGVSREDVLDGFISAQEFVDLCDVYGITAF